MIETVAIITLLAVTVPREPAGFPARNCELTEGDNRVNVSLSVHGGVGTLTVMVRVVDRTPLSDEQITIAWACGNDPNEVRWTTASQSYFSLPGEEQEAWTRVMELVESSDDDGHRKVLLGIAGQLLPRRVR